MKNLAIGSVILSAAVGVCCGTLQAAQGTQEDRFVDWAAGPAVPLPSIDLGLGSSERTVIRGIVGDAKIVTLAEVVHGAHEPLALRNHLLEYLVENLGFTAIALESGISESEILYRYVLGGDGGPSSMVRAGLSWTFDRYQENTALVEWMRKYNSDPSHKRKVHFYGFDMSGSPGNRLASAQQGFEAVELALRYLERVDMQSASLFRDRFEPFRESLDGRRYVHLDARQRDSLSKAVADLDGLFAAHELGYTKRTSELDYQWGRRHATALRQIETRLRRIPQLQPNESPSPGPLPLSVVLSMQASRDLAMAENVDWIVNQEGADGKVLLFASMNHLIATPYTMGSNGPPGQEPVKGLGHHLKEKYGDRLVAIGHALQGGSVLSSGGEVERLPETEPISFTGVLSRLGMPRFLLDLRGAPSEIALWLRKEQSVWPWRFAPAKGFDVLFYTRSVTPATTHRVPPPKRGANRMESSRLLPADP